MKVKVCPVCKLLFVYRENGRCKRCGIPIVYDKEVWTEDDLYDGKLGTMTHKQGLKRSKKNQLTYVV